MRIRHSIFMSRERGVPPDNGFGRAPAPYGGGGRAWSYGEEDIEDGELVADVDRPVVGEVWPAGETREGEALILPGPTVVTAPWEQPTTCGYTERVWSTPEDRPSITPDPAPDAHASGEGDGGEYETHTDALVPAPAPGGAGGGVEVGRVVAFLKTPFFAYVALRSDYPMWVRLLAVGAGWVTRNDPGGLLPYLRSR